MANTLVSSQAPKGAQIARTVAPVSSRTPKGAQIARTVASVLRPGPSRPLVGQLWP